MVEVAVRGVRIEVRSASLTKALLKQCRVFTADPPKPFCEIVTNEQSVGHVQVLPEFAVGWFRGTVLGDDERDYVVFAKDGDVLLGRFWKTMMRWKMPKECKQLYIA